MPNYVSRHGISLTGSVDTCYAENPSAVAIYNTSKSKSLTFYTRISILVWRKTSKEP